MAYQRFKTMDIYNILQRWHRGYRVMDISRALQIDRKTVRKYITLARETGVSQKEPLPDKDELLKRLDPLIPKRERSQPARALLLPYKDEIIQLVSQTSEPLKPKTAYEVICERHGLKVSYTSFKRFVREHIQPHLAPEQTTCRLETEPGEEIQIDYGKVGRIFDPLNNRNRDVYAFVASLSFSRLKFVEFVFKQDQRSFVNSMIRMFEFFDGVALRLVIDNLKAGVIKPDLYLPKLNRAFQEMADHYGCFIDPARPRHPKDKGKVERVIPLVRQQFRKLKALHADLDIAKANRESRAWCLHKNGMTEHGTTGIKPYEAFQAFEKHKLKKLPINHFEIATWKEAKVHVDQFIQFEKGFYSLPQRYVGQRVWVKGTEKLVQIFDDHILIKTHLRANGKRQTDSKDFPKNAQIMLENKHVQALLDRGQCVGTDFRKLLQEVLEPHAMLNYRRALALLRLVERYDKERLNQAARLARSRKIHTPKQLEILLDKLDQQHQEQAIPISTQTEMLLRDAEYFIQPNQT